MTEKEKLIAIEEILTKAELEADEEKLNELLLPDFIGVNFHGNKIDKAGFISGLCHSGLKMETLEIKDLDITIADSFAIVVGNSIFTINKYNFTAHYMDVWRKQDDEWKLNASSVTPVKT